MSNFKNRLRDEFLSILENFFQSCRIFGGKSISAIYTVLGAITQPPAQIVFYFYEILQSSHQLRIGSHVTVSPPEGVMQ